MSAMDNLVKATAVYTTSESLIDYCNKKKEIEECKSVVNELENKIKKQDHTLYQENEIRMRSINDNISYYLPYIMYFCIAIVGVILLTILCQFGLNNLVQLMTELAGNPEITSDNFAKGIESYTGAINNFLLVYVAPIYCALMCGYIFVYFICEEDREGLIHKIVLITTIVFAVLVLIVCFQHLMILINKNDRYSFSDTEQGQEALNRLLEAKQYLLICSLVELCLPFICWLFYSISYTQVIDRILDCTTLKFAKMADKRYFNKNKNKVLDEYKKKCDTYKERIAELEELSPYSIVEESKSIIDEYSAIYCNAFERDGNGQWVIDFDKLSEFHQKITDCVAIISQGRASTVQDALKIIEMDKANRQNQIYMERLAREQKEKNEIERKKIELMRQSDEEAKKQFEKAKEELKNTQNKINDLRSELSQARRDLEDERIRNHWD